MGAYSNDRPYRGKRLVDLLLLAVVALPALAIGALLLWTGMQWNRIEQIVGGAGVTVISIVVYIANNIDNDVLQGVAITAVGVVGLVLTTLVVRRQRHHQRAYVTTTGA